MDLVLQLVKKLSGDLDWLGLTNSNLKESNMLSILAVLRSMPPQQTVRSVGSKAKARAKLLELQVICAVYCVDIIAFFGLVLMWPPPSMAYTDARHAGRNRRGHEHDCSNTCTSY